MRRHHTYSLLLAFLANLASLFSGLPLNAQFEYTPACAEAQQTMFDLRTASAREILSMENKQHPGNGMVVYLENYADVIELIITDDKARYDRLMENYATREGQVKRMNDPTGLGELLQAEMLFYAGLAQLKYGPAINGASKIYSSYRAVNAHLQKYPDLKLNLKMAGMFNIMMDFIPQSVRWIASIFGVTGDSDKGMAQLLAYYEEVKNTPGLAQEAVIIINLAYKLTWEDEQGLEFMSGLETGLTDNSAARYLWAITATYTFQNDLALEKLGAIDRDNFEVPFYYLDYIEGRCRLNALDPKAEESFRRFLEEYPGTDFRKDVCNRLSYLYLLQGNTREYKRYRALMATTGGELRDRDIEAMKEAGSDITPHTGLLKARMLFDGGYFTAADSVMHGIPVNSLDIMAYRLEYYYRQGRIDQVMGNTDQAMANLEKVVMLGADQPYTFATRAALQMGGIYEEKKDYREALTWYKLCLDYFDEDHTSGSVEDKALKGKKRMENLL